MKRHYFYMGWGYTGCDVQMERKLSGRCKQEVILKRQLHPERKYVIILTEIPLVA